MKLKTAKAAVVEAEVPGELRYVPLDHLVDHEEINNRKLDKEHVAELAESIAKNGLDVPLIAWTGGEVENQMQVGEGKKAPVVPATFLVAGFHRRAALLAFRKEDLKKFEKIFPEGIPTKVIHGDIQEALFAQLRENCARVNPDAEDILPFVERLSEEFGLKKNVIAAKVGKSPAWVSEVLSIKKHLGKEGSDEVKKGGVSLRSALGAVKDVKKNKVDAKTALAKAKAKKKGRGAASEKKVSVKTLYGRYKALPNLKIGQSKTILEGLLDYVTGESDELPDELEGSEE